MKPRNREVSIFNMSVLDLLTGALGAFCFLTLALFPYYYKASGATTGDSSQLESENASLRAKIEAHKATGGQLPPFALIDISNGDDQGNSCADMHILKVASPLGPSGISSYPGQTDPSGRVVDLLLLAFKPGAYTVTVGVGRVRPKCSLGWTVDSAAGANQTLLLNGAPSVTFQMNIGQADFANSLFDNG